MVRLASQSVVDAYAESKIKLLSLHRDPSNMPLTLECEVCGNKWDERYKQDSVLICPECGGEKVPENIPKKRKGLLKRGVKDK